MGGDVVSIGAETRREGRRPTKQIAWLEGKPHDLIVCTILNISNDGAQLVINSDLILPSRFALRLTEDGKEKRGCRITWRKGSRIGVRFFPLPPFSLGLVWANQVAASTG
jgi:hypothetical protein